LHTEPYPVTPSRTPGNPVNKPLRRASLQSSGVNPGTRELEVSVLEGLWVIIDVVYAQRFGLVSLANQNEVSRLTDTCPRAATGAVHCTSPVTA
jgi:hypothetical protein